MVSHAHGQGYADLHFLIPEIIEEIDFGKGPYYADKGNFATAGYVDLKTKEVLKNSLINVQAGSFNSLRLLGLFDLLSTQENHHAYLASEFLVSDGYFESPQNFSRINLLANYTATFNTVDKIKYKCPIFKVTGMLQVRFHKEQWMPVGLVDLVPSMIQKAGIPAGQISCFNIVKQ